MQEKSILKSENHEGLTAPTLKLLEQELKSARHDWWQAWEAIDLVTKHLIDGQTPWDASLSNYQRNKAGEFGYEVHEVANLARKIYPPHVTKSTNSLNLFQKPKFVDYSLKTIGDFIQLNKANKNEIGSELAINVASLFHPEWDIDTIKSNWKKSISLRAGIFLYAKFAIAACTTLKLTGTFDNLSEAGFDALFVATLGSAALKSIQEAEILKNNSVTSTAEVQTVHNISNLEPLTTAFLVRTPGLFVALVGILKEYKQDPSIATAGLVYLLSLFGVSGAIDYLINRKNNSKSTTPSGT